MNGDRNGMLKNTLSSLLSGNKYVVVLRNALYVIEGEISSSELTMQAGLFVRIGAELRIVNGDGVMLQSFTVPQKRCGAHDWEGAYNAAFRYLSQELEKNFIEGITAFIDG
jgi:hypothetical protein